jgi:hypothetical protein
MRWTWWDHGSAEVRNASINRSAVADRFGRTVVVVWSDDKEVVIEPRPELKLDS